MADFTVYEVEQFLDKRVLDGSQIQYLVRWKGFSSDWDTWEPVENLSNCKSKVNKFEKTLIKISTNHNNAKTVVSRNKMARQHQKKTNSVKLTKINEQSKVGLQKLDSTISLEDVFDAVLKGKNKNRVFNKIHGQKYQQSAVARKILNSAKKRVSSPHQSVLSTNQTSSERKPKKFNTHKPKKQKSDSNFITTKNSKVKYSQKKQNKKSWTAVDDEISFSSDDEHSTSDSAQGHKRKNEKDFTQKMKKIKRNKMKNSKKDMNSAAASQPKKLIGKKMIADSDTPKSAFMPVNRKTHFRLSVSKHVGSKKQQKQSKSRSDSKSSRGKASAGHRLKSPDQKRRLHSDSKFEMTIETETDSDSDDEILYSLSDNSELAIHHSNSSQDDQQEIKAVLQSKPDGTLEQGTGAKRKKAALKKSMSASNAGHPSPKKKIKLLDSLKQIPPTIPVRPVSPTPVYTSVKHTNGSMISTSQALLAQPQWILDDGITPNTAQSASLPISPASMSYKVLLENLPQQLHPKNKKKPVENEDSDVERRVSVRASECAFKYKEIVIKKCQKYTQIWLNTHTKMKNALNPNVMNEISSALSASKYDDSNLVMFSGLGNVFCSGIDLQYLTVGDKKVAARKMVDALRDLVRKFITFPKLIVAVVTGPAIGMGSALLPLCDIVYASDKATFYMPYAQLSQTPEGCASFTLPNIVGIAMANELLIGGRKITAIEACQLGLVSQVYWPTSMMQEVIPRVQHMALLSGKALETTKLLMRSHQRTKLDLTNESECNLLLERWPTADCQKAIEEFLSNEKNYML